MASLPSSFLYPSPSAEALRLQYVGKQLKDIQAPAAVLDAAVIRRNCRYVLETAEKLNVGFRAHVKTHKTTELSQAQVGTGSRSIKLVASTLAEIEGLTPWLFESVKAGKSVNCLYGLPVSPSAIPRLATVSRLLGPESIGVFVDHPGHIKHLETVPHSVWPGKIPVWVNVDTGYHREGVPADSKQLADIARALAAAERVKLAGLYSHDGLSYGVSSPEEALLTMSEELLGLYQGAVSFLKNAAASLTPNSDPSTVVLSLGASPTVTAIQNIWDTKTEGVQQYRHTIETIGQSFELEFHAGVYPVMDMQQLATRARPHFSATEPQKSLLTFENIGLRILTEVASVYTDRGEKPEALIAAGAIVLGREPCKSYPGWGVVTPWPQTSGHYYDPETDKTGWIVGRIAQEHGILTWEGPREHFRELTPGDKLMVWPNHACIAGVAFGWYLVVDADKPDPGRIEDVWVRWRGW